LFPISLSIYCLPCSTCSKFLSLHLTAPGLLYYQGPFYLSHHNFSLWPLPSPTQVHRHWLFLPTPVPT
jgi:hypothetical protein